MSPQQRAGRHRAGAPTTPRWRAVLGTPARSRRVALVPAAVVAAGISTAALAVSLGHPPSGDSPPVEAIRERAADAPSSRGPVTSTQPAPTRTRATAGAGVAPAPSAAPTLVSLAPTVTGPSSRPLPLVMTSTATATPRPTEATSPPAEGPTPTGEPSPTAEPTPSLLPEILKPGTRSRPTIVPLPTRRPTP